MTKTEMIAGIAQKAGITKKAAAAALNAVGAIITAELKKGRSLVITGFGTFKVSQRAARTGVNPRNPSEKIKIPAMKVPAFKAGKALKEAVRRYKASCARCRDRLFLTRGGLVIWFARGEGDEKRHFHSCRVS